MRTRWSPILVGVLAAACAGSPPTTVPASAPDAPSSHGLPTPVAVPTPHPTIEPSIRPATPPPLTPTAEPTARPTPRASASPTIEPTIEPTDATAQPTDCPTAPVIFPYEFANADPACFGSRDVTLHAWLDGLPSMGWEAPYIDPAWLAYPPNVPLNALWQRGLGGDAMCGGDDDCAFVTIHLRPGTTIVIGSAPRWVIATGHLADPMAEQCRYELWGGTSPPDSEAQAECRASFVLSAVRDAPPPSQ